VAKKTFGQDPASTSLEILNWDCTNWKTKNEKGKIPYNPFFIEPNSQLKINFTFYSIDFKYKSEDDQMFTIDFRSNENNTQLLNNSLVSCNYILNLHSMNNLTFYSDLFRYEKVKN